MSKSQGTDNHLNLNYKLKDNPFIAGDLVPAAATTAATATTTEVVIRKSTSHPLPQRTLLAKTTTTATASTPTTNAQASVPASIDVRRNVRASVMRMAASNTVSSNPWKTKLNSVVEPCPPLSKRNHPKDESGTNDDLAVLGRSQQKGDGEREAEDNAGHVNPDLHIVEEKTPITTTTALSPLASPETVPPLPPLQSSGDGDGFDRVAEQQTQIQNSLENEEPPFLSIQHHNKVQSDGATDTDSPIVAPTFTKPHNHAMAYPTSSSSAILVQTDDDQGFLHIDSDQAESDSDDDDDDDQDTAGLATPDDSTISEDDVSSHRRSSAVTEFTMVDSLHSSLSDSKVQSTIISSRASSRPDSMVKSEEEQDTAPSLSVLRSHHHQLEDLQTLLPPPSSTSSAIKHERAGGTPLPDTNAMLHELAVAQAAVVAATHFPVYGLLDAQKWLDESAQIRRSVGYLHERLKVETHAQRAIAAVLKLKAEKRDRALASDLQAHATAIDAMVDKLVSTLSVSNNVVLEARSCRYSNNITTTNHDDDQTKLRENPIPETILARLRALAGVEEPMDFEALVSRLEEQRRQLHKPEVDDVRRGNSSDAIKLNQSKAADSGSALAARLKQTEAAFKAAQQEFTQREAALMLQSASVEAELVSVVKEYERVTRNIADFNNERKAYDAEIAKLTRERHMLDKQLVDAKLKWQVGRDGQSMSLRREFRQLMAAVKDEHAAAMQKEIGQRKAVEDTLRSLRHELEVKRWDRVDTGVQTNFVYNSNTP